MNFARELFESAAADPSAIAVRWRGVGNAADLDRRALVARVAGLASFLRSQGLRAGERVALQVVDPVVDLIAFLALTALGVGIYAPAAGAATERRVVALLGIDTTVALGAREIITTRVVDLARFDAAAHAGAPFAPRDEDGGSAPWLVRSSSGTTGIPKIFACTHDEAAFRRARYLDAVPLAPGDRFGSVTPLRFGAARQRYGYALSAGAGVVILDERHDLPSLVEQVHRAGITHLYCVPMHLELLCDHALRTLGDTATCLFPALTSIETSSSVVSPSLRARVERLLCPRLHISYSVSEVGHLASTRKASVREATVNDLGAPVDGVEIRIVDASLQALEAGRRGDIAVRFTGGTTRVAYLDEAGRWQSMTRDGWFLTGDVGYFSAHGNLVFCGRGDDMMIFNGINVFPEEIEAVVRAHPQVEDAVAFCVESRIHHEVPCAAVRLREPVAMDALRAHCRAHLGARAPRLLFAVESFPRNPMGKILRTALRELALRQMSDAARADEAGS